MGKYQTWYIAGSLAEEDTVTPFEGATLAIEHSAYQKAVAALKSIAKEYDDDSVYGIASGTLKELGEAD